jgi:secreted trypsin-like serine protease
MHRIASLLLVLPLAFAGLSSSSAHAGTLGMPVVGGTEAKPGDWPDVVAVIGADGSLCTGTLLAADLVLTAAHCIDGNPVEVIIGSVDLARPDGERRRVKWSRAYPDWIERYDVGVVMLENPVQAKQRAVVQGCTSHPNFDTGLPLQVVGFGLTTASATDDNTRLHQATVPVIDATCTSDPACAPAVAPGGEFTAGGRGADSCFGDSGGPVYITTASGPALIGVVSRGLLAFGEPCASGGVYVRADKVVAWIQSVTDRKIDRVPCDLPTDDGGDHDDGHDDDSARDDGGSDSPGDGGGCNAAGGVHGGLQSGLAIYYAALVLLGLIRLRAGGASRSRRRA